MEQERQEENQKLTKKISPYKIIYPIINGLAVVSYMLYKEFDPKAFDMITFTWNTVFWLFLLLYYLLSSVLVHTTGYQLYVFLPEASSLPLPDILE